MHSFLVSRKLLFSFTFMSSLWVYSKYHRGGQNLCTNQIPNQSLKLRLDTVGEDQMYGAYLSGAGKGKLEYGLLDRPKPGKGQVLIKVESVPINPSDLYCMEGKYSEYFEFGYPFTPGWEGSGTVIETGGGVHAWYLNGKRVAFSKCQEEMSEGSVVKIGGTYAQYAITNAFQCVPIDDEVSFNHAANSFVNPWTAIGLVEQVTNDKGTAVVITAAASQLGKMMIRLFNEKNITVIATVRKEEQHKELKEKFNLEHIYNTEDEGFLQKFKEVTREVNAKHLLECIGGDTCGQLTSSMPKGSVCILYGNLSRQRVGDLDPFAIIGSEITMRGFLLNQWIEKKGIFKLLFLVNKIKKMMKDDLSSEIRKEFDLKDIKEAIEFYESNMSAGKVILKPWGVAEQE